MRMLLLGVPCACDNASVTCFPGRVLGLLHQQYGGSAGCAPKHLGSCAKPRMVCVCHLKSVLLFQGCLSHVLDLTHPGDSVQFEPAVKDAAGKAEPMAKDFTSKTVRPAGDYVADKAVPLTKEYGELLPSPAASSSETVGVRARPRPGVVLLSISICYAHFRVLNV